MKTLNEKSSNYLWRVELPYYRWLPVLFGLGLGALLAYLVTAQDWLLMFSLLLTVPVAILFSRYPFSGVVLWMVLTPLFVLTPDLGQLMIFWVLHRFMIPVVLLATVLPYLFKIKSEWPVRLGIAELVMAAFLGMVILSALLLSENAVPALYKVYERIFIAYCLYLLMRFIAPSEKELKLLVWVAVLVLFIQVTIGLLQNFAPEVLPTQWYSARAAARTIGTFNHPTRYTTTLVFCLLLVYQAAMHWKGLKVHWLLMIAFAMGALLVVLSYSKGSWLGAGVALIGILLLYPKPTLRVTVVVAILYLFFGVGLLADQLAYATERLLNDSTNERMVANIGMLRMLEASPFYGWGYGNVTSLLPKFAIRLDDFAARHSASHNTYMRILAEMGLVGFFLYVFPFIWWFILTIRAWPRMPKAGFTGRSLVIMLWLIILAKFLTANTSDFVNGQSGTFAIALWWVALGLIASLVYPYTHTGAKILSAPKLLDGTKTKVLR